MKELVKPKRKEQILETASAYCEVYDGNTGKTYYQSYWPLGSEDKSQEDEIIF